MSGAKQAREAKVGIIYLVDDKLWIDATPVARALNVGVFVIHERDHQRYWEQMVKRRDAPDTGYDRYPRGRVSYNRKSAKFTLLADICILHERKLINAILSRMHLVARDTETGTDGLYRCFHCLERSR